MESINGNKIIELTQLKVELLESFYGHQQSVASEKSEQEGNFNAMAKLTEVSQ